MTRNQIVFLSILLQRVQIYLIKKIKNGLILTGMRNKTHSNIKQISGGEKTKRNCQSDDVIFFPEKNEEGNNRGHNFKKV